MVKSAAAEVVLDIMQLNARQTQQLSRDKLNARITEHARDCTGYLMAQQSSGTNTPAPLDGRDRGDGVGSNDASFETEKALCSCSTKILQRRKYERRRSDLCESMK